MAKVNDEYPGKPLSDQKLKQIATQQYTENKNDESVEEVVAYDFPTEIVELPSQGKFYPADHILSSGKIEMKYMSAKEEDILTNQSFIKNGVVLDKLFQSLIVTDVNYNDLLICDKNSIMIAARILGYGKDYECKVINPATGNEVEAHIDLTDLKEKNIDWSLIKDGQSEFEMELPVAKRKVKLKMLTQGDQNKIDKETKGLKKLKKDAAATTLLKYIITELDGDTDKAKIRKFVDRELLAIDSRSIRQYLRKITPDIDLKVDVPDEETGDTFRTSINIGLDFFWPDIEV
jgi:hypothetical protein